MTRRILVTGALGQIGSELVTALRQRHGSDRVVASDIRMQPAGASQNGPFEHVDCTNLRQIQDVVRRHDASHSQIHFDEIVERALFGERLVLQWLVAILVRRGRIGARLRFLFALFHHRIYVLSLDSLKHVFEIRDRCTGQRSF